jgi:hypothetical protein
MKKLSIAFIIISILLPLTFSYSQTFMNVKYNDGSEKNKEISSLRKITFTSSGSQINYYLTGNTTLIEDISILRKITFGASGSGDPLPVELTSFNAKIVEGKTVLN